MGQKLHNRIETWKKLLLDFGKRNRLINFLETKRGNVKITIPSFERMFNEIVSNEKTLTFPYSKIVSYNEYLKSYQNFKVAHYLKHEKKHNDEIVEEITHAIIEMPGQISTNVDVLNLESTLKNLRSKANTAIEEQGINTLFLAFGMLKWNEKDGSDKFFLSPLILVPVKLSIESLTSPYKLSLHEDEIVVNPTLLHKLENDFGIFLPEFDSTENTPDKYLDFVLEKVNNKGWSVERNIFLTNLSFLKINMYRDLERNEDVIESHPIISALAGEQEPSQISDELNNFDHDKQIRPIDTFQVLDADSSQQDAILLSKKGVSFVLQGPPGTGKSQTITNIIAEAIADGKKILFVSEKMAALQVVYNRLTSVGLADFCFTLHSHKAKKKEILDDLANSMHRVKTRIKDETLNQLDILERKRAELNKYQEELHTLTSGLNVSIYTVNGRLSKLEDIPDLIFSIDSVDKVTDSELNEKVYLLQKFANTITKRSEDYSNNAWNNSSVKVVTNELRHDIDSNVSTLINKLNDIDVLFANCCDSFGLDLMPSMANLEKLVDLLAFVSKSPLIPTKWVYDDINSLRSYAQEHKTKTTEITNGKHQLSSVYNDKIFDIDGKQAYSVLDRSKVKYHSLLKYDKINSLIENINDTVSKIGIILDKVSEVCQQSSFISKDLGFNDNSSLNKIVELYQVCCSIKQRIRPANIWFNNNEFSNVQKYLASDKKNHTDVVTLINEVKTLYREEIIEYDCKDILKKINKDYSLFVNKISQNKIDLNDSNAFSELRTISSKLRLLNGKIELVEDIVNNICTALSINMPSTLGGIIDIVEFAEALSKGITPSEKWFNHSQYTSIKDSLDSVIKEHVAARELRDKICNVFDKEILSIDYYPILKRFRGDYNSSIKRFFSSKYKEDIAELKRYLRDGSKLSYDEAFQYLSLIKDYSDKINSINTELYSSDYGTYYSGIDTDWQKIKETLDYFDKILLHKNLFTNKLKNLWVDSDFDYELVAKEVQKYKQVQLFEYILETNQYLSDNIYNTHKISDVRKTIVSLSDEIFTFVDELSDNINNVNAFAIKDTDLSITNYFNLIKKICEIQGTIKNISQDENKYLSRYGINYKGIYTDWDKINESLTIFKKLNEQHVRIPDILKDKLINDTLNYENIINFISTYENCNFEKGYEELKNIFAHRVIELYDFNLLKNTYIELKDSLNEFNNTYDSIRSLRKNSNDFQVILEEIKYLSELQRDEAFLKDDKIKSKLGNFYNDIKTDWEKLFDAIRFAEDFRVYIDTYSLSPKFIEEICSNKQVIDYCIDTHEKLKQSRNSIDKPYNWFKSLFNETQTFDTYCFKNLIERLTICKNKKHLLEEWVDYSFNKEECVKKGLSSYIEIVEREKVKDIFIVDAYLKRFYRLWLDAVLPNFIAVQNFRGYVHKQTIHDFCQLDKNQFKIAQARIKQRALNRIPDFNSINGARGEIAILKREVNKKRKIMPLRKLFKEIPNLITSLRPCFMMSPLSVSVFLEAGNYKFDMVIFDEASQVHTEDAIGAIMRGKQIIIVGDTKQLPPTNFFTTTLNDDDYDVDSEDEVDDDAGTYESILDESVTIMPERSLRWHYRSRHEHLIAFSNVKIYNNQLITFPSSIEKAADIGVEYVYVKNGIYERKGKKINKAEAEKVAELVFEHFKKHPERSLGVVTFSEAQQNAVDAAIRNKRLQNPGFDHYFNEEKEEPFFVKNLENVQGDERDAIIFSIGYAKDANGVMYMNFGPLNREGGYRRLNVAITRAKFNVKLVGSIVPTDIDLYRTSSEGVKLLRSYIEFAQQGVVALENEIKLPSSIEFDSPFEESVYDFLQSKGYNVVTQVGCSGYRIDLAIKHPTQSGKFVIGIECDGATYHSSRTARERDRLRQSVLEDMGWTIYRIWSTDWIKDQKNEEEKLVNAIEKALGHLVNNEDSDFFENNNYNIDTILEIEEKTETSETTAATEIYGAHYGFEPYNRLHPLNLVDENKNKRKLHEIILDVIIAEQPIHFEELCRRVAPALDRLKATSFVYDSVRDILRKVFKGIITEDSSNFIKLYGFKCVKVRCVNADDDYMRSISYISDEELELALKMVAHRSIGFTADDLFIATARGLGFKRTSENIISTFRRIYAKLIECKDIIESEGKVCVNNTLTDSNIDNNIDVEDILVKTENNVSKNPNIIHLNNRVDFGHLVSGDCVSEIIDIDEILRKVREDFTHKYGNSFYDKQRFQELLSIQEKLALRSISIKELRKKEPNMDLIKRIDECISKISSSR